MMTMTATLTLDDAGAWHYVGAARERDERGHFIAAAEVAEAIATYIAREALRLSAVVAARTIATILTLALPTNAGQVKRTRIAETGGFPIRYRTPGQKRHEEQVARWGWS